MSDDELEKFKRDVNLVELASSYGYSVVRKESCRTSIVMKKPSEASKIIIATGEDGHGIFFDVHADVSGSVIDFVKYHEGCNLGGARVRLREYLGQPRLKFPIQEFSRPAPTTRNRAHTAATWQKCDAYSGGYLEGRGLTTETIGLFFGHIRLMASFDGKHQNVAFRHDDQAGLTGWELKNRGFTGFVGGGGKALFACQVGESGPPTRIVITEAAIDAMSYYQLSQKPGLYISLAGNLSPEQQALLKKTLMDNPQAKIVTATDADRDGEKYAVFINSIRPDAVRAYPRNRAQPASKYKDWNDVLTNRPVQADMTPPSPPHAGQVREPVAAHEVTASVTPVNWRGRGQSAIPPKINEH